MTLTRACPRDYEDGDINILEVAASTIIYEGSAIGINSSGYARPIQVGDDFAGFSLNVVDNSAGENGDLTVRAKESGRVILPISTADLTTFNSPVYATDDNTFTLESSNAVFVGYIHRVINSGIIVLKFNATVPESLSEAVAVTRAEWLQNGFVDRTKSTMTFTDETRAFSIQPTETNFNFYQDGIKFTSAGETLQIDNTEGEWVIYYDEGVLTALNSPTDGDISIIIRTKCIVAWIYWNADDEEIVYFGEERHGYLMNPITHARLHFVDGLVYQFGLAISDLSVDGDGSSNAHSQFGSTLGAIADEDIFFSISAVAPTTGFPVLYFIGDNENPKLRKGTNAGYPFLMGGTLPYYNQDTGTVRQLTEMTSGKLAWVHLLATTDLNTPMFVHAGLDQYDTETGAKRGLTGELEKLINGFAKISEYRYVGSGLLLANSSFTNTNKCAFVSTLEGRSYQDLRTANMSRNIVDIGINEASLYQAEAYLDTPATTTLATSGTWYIVQGDFENKIQEGFSFVAGPPPGVECEADFKQSYRVEYSGAFECDTQNEQIEFALIKDATTSGTAPSVAITNPGNILPDTVNGARTFSTGADYPIAKFGEEKIENAEVTSLIARCTTGNNRDIVVNYMTLGINPKTN